MNEDDVLALGHVMQLFGERIDRLSAALEKLEVAPVNTAQQANTAIALLKQWAEYCEAGGVNADHQLCQATIEFAGQHQ